MTKLHVVKSQKTVLLKFNSIPDRARDIYLFHHVQAGLGIHSASFPMNIEGSSSEVIRPKREADYAPPLSV
jgi:hypothetical protein